MTMTKISIWHEGDASVGIQGDTATLEMDISYMDAADWDFVVEQLKDAFTTIWDFKVYVEIVG
jgi:hypothetical protein